jgi:hypothetical protein
MRDLGWQGLIEIAIVLGILVVGLFYAWRNGAPFWVLTPATRRAAMTPDGRTGRKRQMEDRGGAIAKRKSRAVPTRGAIHRGRGYAIDAVAVMARGISRAIQDLLLLARRDDAYSFTTEREPVG